MCIIQLFGLNFNVKTSSLQYTVVHKKRNMHAYTHASTKTVFLKQLASINAVKSDHIEHLNTVGRKTLASKNLPDFAAMIIANHFQNCPIMQSTQNTYVPLFMHYPVECRQCHHHSDHTHSTRLRILSSHCRPQRGHSGPSSETID